MTNGDATREGSRSTVAQWPTAVVVDPQPRPASLEDVEHRDGIAGIDDPVVFQLAWLEAGAERAEALPRWFGPAASVCPAQSLFDRSELLSADLDLRTHQSSGRSWSNTT